MSQYYSTILMDLIDARAKQYNLGSPVMRRP